MGINKLLIDHVGLSQVVIVAVHLVIFCAGWVKTFLIKALCSQISASWLKVVGWWWSPQELYCHLL